MTNLTLEGKTLIEVTRNVSMYMAGDVLITQEVDEIVEPGEYAVPLFFPKDGYQIKFLHAGKGNFLKIEKVIRDVVSIDLSSHQAKLINSQSNKI